MRNVFGGVAATGTSLPPHPTAVRKHTHALHTSTMRNLSARRVRDRRRGGGTVFSFGLTDRYNMARRRYEENRLKLAIRWGGGREVLTYQKKKVDDFVYKFPYTNNTILLFSFSKSIMTGLPSSLNVIFFFTLEKLEKRISVGAVFFFY